MPGPSTLVVLQQAAAAPGYPKMETLFDPFDASDPAKWVDAPNVSIVGGQLQLTTSTTYQGRKSVLLGDLTNSYAVTPMIQTSGNVVAGGTVDTSFILQLDANNSLSFTREGQTLFAQRTVGGTLSTVASIVGWSATTHRWLRFLHNGTTVAWQYSADGISWTTMGTPWAPTFPVTGLKAYFETGMYTGNTAGSGTPALFDSFNLPPGMATVSWQSEVSATALQLGWILTSGTSVRAVAAIDAAFTTPIYGDTITRPTSGWCTSRVTGLTANTVYYTGVEVDGVFIASGRGQYRTLRTDLAAAKVITSSCYAIPSDLPVLARIKTEAPAFFVQQGDIHYWDATTDAEWRTGFSDAVTSVGLAATLATVPMPYFWNNHDWGGDASSATSPVASFAPPAVRELSGSIYPDTKGLWRTWAHAGVRYINLDPYAHRSPYTDADTSAKTMLGATQKAWFLNLLQTATEPAIVVFSGFAHPSIPAGTGRWASYPNERVEIGNAIAAITSAQRSKIVFVGGDTHSICADDGANAMWGRPTLNASPLQGTGNGAQAGTWNITNQAADSARGYFSRLTFTPGATLAMTWDAVRDDGVVMATWSTSFALAVTVTGTGALSATPATLSGAGTLALTGSGAAAATAATLSGAGALRVTGAGTPTATPATLSGTGSLTLTSAGSLTATPATLSGSGTVTGATVMGTGALAATPATLAGTGTERLTGTGALSPSPATLSGSGTVAAPGIVSGAGALAGPAAGMSGAGTLKVVGAGQLAAQAATLAASALLSLAGAGTLGAPPSGLSGDGAVTAPVAGSGVLVAVQASLTGTGTVVDPNAPIVLAGPLETLTVGADNRTTLVGGQARTVEVGGEVRRFQVHGDPRTELVPAALDLVTAGS